MPKSQITDKTTAQLERDTEHRHTDSYTTASRATSPPSFQDDCKTRHDT